MFDSVDDFGKFGDLALLYMNNNKLTSDGIAKSAFDNLSQLQVLTLDNNQLETPEARWFKSLKRLQTFSWNNNPWNCNCQAVPFAQLLESDLVNRRFQAIIADTVQCQTPPDFAGSFIDDIGVHGINEEFTCVFTTPAGFTTPKPEKCPFPCGCYKNPATGFFGRVVRAFMWTVTGSN